MGLKSKTNQENKQKTNKLNKQQKKNDTLPTQSIFQKDFSEVVYLFLSQKYIKQGWIMYVMGQCHLLCVVSL